MKNIFLVLSALAVLGFSSCKDSLPSAPQVNYGPNLLTNSGFTTTTVTAPAHLDGQSFPPWNVLYGAPWIWANYNADSNGKGHLYLWGTSDDGCAVYQPLATSIKSGHTYHVTAALKFNHENTTPYVSVRFIAYNQIPSSAVIPWEGEVPGQQSIIGMFTVTGTGSWNQYVTEDWTANADYTNFSINAQNGESGPGSESWAHVDNVTLNERQ